VGFVGNINYLQMIDLAAGFAGFDLCGDDGLRFGLWPWQAEHTPSERAETLRAQIFGLTSEKEPDEHTPGSVSSYVGRGKLALPPSAPAAAAAPKKEER